MDKEYILGLCFCICSLAAVMVWAVASAKGYVREKALEEKEQRGKVPPPKLKERPRIERKKTK